MGIQRVGKKHRNEKCDFCDRVAEFCDAACYGITGYACYYHNNELKRARKERNKRDKINGEMLEDWLDGQEKSEAEFQLNI